MFNFLKKLLHLICVIVFGSVLTGCFFLLVRKIFLLIYHLDLLDIQTYQIFSQFWNEGGVLRIKELSTLALIVLIAVLCLYCWKKLYNFRFIKILSVPLNWFFNHGLDNYGGMVAVNIKNLKIEEKKTIEQIVQERLELERKKESECSQKNNFRATIIEEIEKKKKKI